MKTETTTEYFGTTTTTVSVMANGAVDFINRKMCIELTSIGGEVMTNDMEFLVYLIDDTFYMKMKFMGYEGWLKIETSDFFGIGSSLDSYWDSCDQMLAQKELLETAEVDLLPSEYVNGIDCYVLKLTPATEVILDTLSGQMGMGSGMLQTSSFSYTIEEFYYTLAIAKDTNFIMKMYGDISMNAVLDGYTTSVKVEMTIVLTEHNNSVEIELSAEAVDAKSYTEFLSDLAESFGSSMGFADPA